MDQNTPNQQLNPVNPTPQTEKPKNILFRRIESKWPLILIIIFGCIAIGISGYFLYQEYYRDKSTVASVKNDKKTITIESEPAGISMVGDPQCDSTKLGKTTPYDCELPDDATETTIVAPGGIEKDGKIYVFQSWDGCSASNTDMKVCKIEKNGNKKIKANYIIDKSITSLDQLNNQSSSQPITSDGVNQEAGDQCKNTLSIDQNNNTATCSVYILSLSFGFKWVNDIPAKEPPITITCISAINSGYCSQDYRASNEAFQPQNTRVIALNTPTVVNDTYNIGANFKGTPFIPYIKIGKAAIPYQSLMTGKFSFPYKYSSNGKEFTFDGLEESNNYSYWRAGVHKGYYLTWKYKASN